MVKIERESFQAPEVIKNTKVSPIEAHEIRQYLKSYNAIDYTFVHRTWVDAPAISVELLRNYGIHSKYVAELHGNMTMSLSYSIVLLQDREKRR